MSKSSSSSDLNPYSQFGFTTPSLGDWLKSTKFKYTSPTGTDAAAAAATSIPNSNPYSDRVKAQLEFEKGYFPIWQQMQEAAAKSAASSTRQQIADLYPYLSSASAEATARNLAASTQFLLAKEQTPTAQALRDQIAQGQIATSTLSDAERDKATATQQQAATQFARRYANLA